MKFILILIILVIVSCDKTEQKVEKQKSADITKEAKAATDSISLSEKLKQYGIAYSQPYYEHPKIIMYNDKKYGIPKDTIDANNMVKFSSINDYILTKDWEKERRESGRKFKNIVKKVSHYMVVDSIVIALFVEIYKQYSYVGKFDLVIFGYNDNNINIMNIYPESIGNSKWCSTKIYHLGVDSVKIGNECDEEGSVLGFFRYMTVNDSGINFYREEIIRGHAYSKMFSSGNPVKGATAKRYLNKYYNHDGMMSERIIHYTALDSNGFQIYGTLISDSLSLYKLYWNSAGEFIRKVVPGSRKIKVGERSQNRYRKPFIAVEYNGTWYWTPANDISLVEYFEY